MICICMQPKEQDGLQSDLWFGKRRSSYVARQKCVELHVDFIWIWGTCNKRCKWDYWHVDKLVFGPVLTIWLLPRYESGLIVVEHRDTSNWCFFSPQTLFLSSSISQTIFRSVASVWILAKSYGFQRYLKLHGQQQIFLYVCMSDKLFARLNYCSVQFKRKNRHCFGPYWKVNPMNPGVEKKKKNKAW